MRNGDPYLLETVLRGCDLLKAFREGESLRLKDLVERTGMHKTIVFRLARTLENGGLLERCGDREYQLKIRWTGRRRYRMGYAAQTEDSFSAAVTDSISHAASEAGVELVVFNNRSSRKMALANAERLVREHVDLAFEFQTYESIAPMIAARFQDAGIPLIAIEIPHPGATYYGVNNYQVGLCGGRLLAHWAKQHWQGHVDQILLLEQKAAGPVPQLRLTGIETGLREVLGQLGRESFVHLDSGGEFGKALDLVRRHLRHGHAAKTLIGGINDFTVLGALRAFDEAGRLSECAAVSHGAVEEARAEMRQPKTRLIGSVAFYPERYGDTLIRMAISILEKKHVPPAVYAEHLLITPANVNRFYPAPLEHLVSQIEH